MFCNQNPPFGYNMCNPHCFFTSKECESRNSANNRPVVVYPFYTCQPCLRRMWNKSPPIQQNSSKPSTSSSSKRKTDAEESFYVPAKKKNRSNTTDGCCNSNNKMYSITDPIEELRTRYPNFDFPEPIKIKKEPCDDILKPVKKSKAKKSDETPKESSKSKKSEVKKPKLMPKFAKERAEREKAAKEKKKSATEPKKKERKSNLPVPGWYSKKYGRNKFNKPRVKLEKLQPDVLLELVCDKMLKPVVEEPPEEPEKDQNVFPVALWATKDSIPLKPFKVSYVENWLGGLKSGAEAKISEHETEKRANNDEQSPLGDDFLKFLDSVSLKSVEQIDSDDPEKILAQNIDEVIVDDAKGDKDVSRITPDDSMEIENEPHKTFSEYNSLLQMPLSVPLITPDLSQEPKTDDNAKIDAPKDVISTDDDKIEPDLTKKDENFVNSDTNEPENDEKITDDDKIEPAEAPIDLDLTTKDEISAKFDTQIPKNDDLLKISAVIDQNQEISVDELTENGEKLPEIAQIPDVDVKNEEIILTNITPIEISDPVPVIVQTTFMPLIPKLDDEAPKIDESTPVEFNDSLKVTPEEESILLEEDITLLTIPGSVDEASKVENGAKNDEKVEEVYFESKKSVQKSTDPLEVDPLTAKMQ